MLNKWRSRQDFFVSGLKPLTKWQTLNSPDGSLILLSNLSSVRDLIKSLFNKKDPDGPCFIKWRSRQDSNLEPSA